MNPFTVGLVQFGVDRAKERNLEKLRNLMSGKRDAELIVLPEYVNFNLEHLSPEEAFQLADSLDGAFMTSLQEMAKTHKVYLVGALLTKSPYPPKVYNTAFLIRPDGHLLATYRKIHLYDAYHYKESEYVMPGNEKPRVIDIGKTKVVLSICFDLRFPELYRTAALEGAELFLTPAAWYSGPMKEETLLTLARARAIENTSYMVMASQFSKVFTGRSAVVDPYGTVMMDMGAGEKYGEITLDLDVVRESRTIIPTLTLRRPEVYFSRNGGA
ncbi:MAG: Aliphatic amidase AmiE [Hydrogenibacillus schlegelii]|uniref:Aliphatic amidase AmiE n=1 Tax=Hydrogenibacillus schlegelii TaxID=1484 RepID=A0A2T5GEL8_HYDSH|nr:carbon-nitrogen hydrolase family protein [Hydrogenibacillus schlegelii]PTQ54620.1 MAG: Aliphatic amidase AmiE [Hydrogenibacillus schlegelii]